MPREEKTPKYTTIIHEVRINLDLSCNEYCVADAISALSNNPSSIIPGWCFASKEYIGKFMGISKRGTIDLIAKLIEKGLVEKDEQTKYLRTTQLWYNSVVLERLKMKNKDGEETSQAVKKLHQRGEETSPQTGEETSPNKNKHIRTSNKSLAPHDGAGKQTNDLIDLFKKVNPSWERLFPNKTQRKAIERMVKKLGVEKIKFVIEKLPATNKIPYAPTITTPLQLESKLGALIAFYQRKKAESENKGIKINTIL